MKYIYKSCDLWCVANVSVILLETARKTSGPLRAVLLIFCCKISRVGLRQGNQWAPPRAEFLIFFVANLVGLGYPASPHPSLTSFFLLMSSPSPLPHPLSVVLVALLPHRRAVAHCQSCCCLELFLCSTAAAISRQLRTLTRRHFHHRGQ
jgi:hypothetical protein